MHMSARASKRTSAGGLAALNARIVACTRCPRLVAYRRNVVPRRAFEGQRYWAAPVPTSGGAGARLWIIGLAPAAHGGNRTGRMFTGDRSGDFLYAALHRAGFASSPVSASRDDGTRLIDCAISASARCAPPGNRPTPEELRRCSPWLDEEWDLLRRVEVIVALGRVAFDASCALYRRHGLLPGRRPRFAHGLQVADRAGGPVLLASFHVSQQNTFTGRLTPRMLDAVLGRARKILRGC
jgi:uracil-DNA glycosylase family 4